MDETTRHYYETTMSEWLAVEAIVRQRDKEKTANAVAKLSSESNENQKAKGLDHDAEIENDVFEENGFSDLSDPEDFDEQADRPAPQNEKPNRQNKTSTDSGNVPDEDGDTKGSVDIADKAKDDARKETIHKTKFSTDSGNVLDEEGESKSTDIIADKCTAANTKDEIHEETEEDKDELKDTPLEPPSRLHINDLDEDNENVDSNKSSPSASSYETVANDFADLAEQSVDEFKDTEDVATELVSPSGNHHAVIITDASIDIVNLQNEGTRNGHGDTDNTLSPLQEEATNGHSSLDALQEPKSACVSPASSNGGIYSVSIFF